MAQENTYSITVKNIKKTVTIVAGHLTSKEAAQQFITEYKNKIATIQADAYILEIDSRNMKVVTQDLSDSLVNAFRLYQESGFKQVKFIIKEDPILKMQYGRIARTAGLKNIEFVN